MIWLRTVKPAPMLKQAYPLIQEFVTMVNLREGNRLDGWLVRFLHASG
jgi:hypothetical protein